MGCYFIAHPLINATKQEIEQALRDFAQRMEEGGVNIFYYSGHGVQIDGDNYLLPVGLDEASSEVSVRYNAVPLDYVVAEMFSVAHDLNFLIIDACRNNPFFSRWGRPKGPGNQGLASLPDLPRGTMIAYATQVNEVALDSIGGDYSPFTDILLRYLDVPNLNIFELLTQVTGEVETRTDGDQIPYWEGNPKDTIALNTSTISTPQPSLPAQPPVEMPPTPSPILISGTTGVNYQPLQDALAAGDFNLADQTTRNLMLRASGRITEGWFREEDLGNFSCEDLKIIDQLWLDYSDGRFGFSTQQKIYQSLGGIEGEYEPAIWANFGYRVGWRRNSDGLLLDLDELTYDLSAPQGHLPTLRSVGEWFDYLGRVYSPTFLWKPTNCSAG